MKHVKIFLGEWQADLPDWDNPGLTEARNVTPVDRFYAPFLPLNGSSTALPSRAYGAGSFVDTSGVAYIYAGESTTLSAREGSEWTAKGRATAYATAATSYWRFAQFDDYAIATNYNDIPQTIAIGTTGSFADITAGGMGTAPPARQVGVINRFLVFGNTNDSAGTIPNRVRWSGIDDHTQWPTPGSSTALSVQSGAEVFDATYRDVTGITNGEQFGIIFQRGGIHRMTYIGGSLVFQIDTIERARGCIAPNGLAQVGQVTYFPAADGFFVTDGVTVKSIGNERVDNLFGDDVDTQYLYRVCSAIDFHNQNIYWAYPGSGNTGGRPNKLLIYNYREGRWTNAQQEAELIFNGLSFAVTLDELDNYFASLDLVTPSLDAQIWKGGNNLALGFNSSNEMGAFSGSAGVARLETQEVQLHPDGRAIVLGVKPVIDEGGLTPTITIQVGYRDTAAQDVTYTPAMPLNSRTRMAPFRTEARYHRVRLNVTGNFRAVMGIEFLYEDAGRV